MINKYLNDVRKPIKDIKLSKKIINTCLIFLLGIVLGAFSKWLDNMAIDDTIWWQQIIGSVDLRNIFSEFAIWILIAISISVFSNSPKRASLNIFLFFIGLNISYHLYTIVFSGFDPLDYMMIWYTITLVSPLLAYISWYAKGKGILSLIINIGLLTFMLNWCFGIGFWYFNFRGIIYSGIFIAVLIVLYDNYKKTIYSVIGSIILAFILSSFIYF